MSPGEQGAKGQWHWCHIHFASVRELIRLHTGRKAKGEWIGEWNQNERQHILHIYSCCKSDWVKDGPHSLPFEPKNASGTQSRDLSIPVSHSWYGLIAEPWVKCLNTREAYNLVSLGILFQFLAVCSWVFFRQRLCPPLYAEYFLWSFSELKVTSVKELSLLLRMGHRKAV